MSQHRDELDCKKVRAELVRVAKKRGLVTYGELAKTLGLPTKDSPRTWYRITDLLNLITEDEQTGGRPMLCSVAVGTTNNGPGVPGDGFFAEARKLRYLLTMEPVIDLGFWQRERDATWDVCSKRGVEN